MKIILLILGLVCSGLSYELDSAVVGAQVPRFSTDLVSGGQRLVLRKWVDSGYAVVISFSASWCAPCRRELAVLRSLADAKPKQIRFLVVLAEDVYGDKQKKFVQSLNWNVPVMLDDGAFLSKRFGVGAALPTTILVEPGGLIRQIRRGFGDGEEEELSRSVLGLLP